ncbi:hypothetical protein [Cytobacillus purgationiresistens]|uniref:Site-specific recombinase XerD n=1 Tax=Cytobacillus purgationiresistens TaxID=863449 RepID=A0ABU0AK44_9BACI|nr:hypothetical protein [Cytobacillus purgationiresistens]MDQ0271249.1 site-specific recombinase XerD [Cytobacillus purgationiresistens]
MKNQMRKDFIDRQFTHANSFTLRMLQPSLDRVSTFLTEETNVRFITFVSEEHISAYFRHHHNQNFNILSFSEVIKDLKNLKFFLTNFTSSSRIMHLDFSVSSIQSWIEPPKEVTLVN